MNREKMMERLSELPLYVYDFVEIEEISFSARARYICEHECPRYNKTWACPPAVGDVDSCIERLKSYDGCLMISTITEVHDIADIEATLATRHDHEIITRRVRDMMREECSEVYVLSTESCEICSECAWPDGPCRHPDQMFPCVESHAVLVTDIAERHGIDFLAGSNLVTWFSLLFYR